MSPGVFHTCQQKNVINMKVYYSTRVQAPNFVSGEACVNDSASVKPSGPLEDDERDKPKTHITKKTPKKSHTLSCKRTCKIGTLNVRTIKALYKRLELANLFKGSGIEILGIQEHRIIHEDPILTTKLGRDSYMRTYLPKLVSGVSVADGRILPICWEDWPNLITRARARINFASGLNKI